MVFYTPGFLVYSLASQLECWWEWWVALWLMGAAIKYQISQLLLNSQQAFALQGRSQKGGGRNEIKRQLDEGLWSRKDEVDEGRTRLRALQIGLNLLAVLPAERDFGSQFF